MRDTEILQAKMAVRILGGLRDERDSWQTIRCPNAAYETGPSESEADKP